MRVRPIIHCFNTLLIEENLLDAVIGLPANLFFGIGIPAAIMVFKRRKADKSVLFIDASREFADVKKQNQLRDEDIARIVSTYQQRESVDKYAYRATVAEIRGNDFNLNIPRYVDTFEEEELIDLAVVQGEIDEIERELLGLKATFQGYLRSQLPVNA